MEKNFLLGVGITNAKTNNVLQYIVTGLQKPQNKYYIVTPNPEILVYATHHPEFKHILNQARLALPDGVGVLWAGKILGNSFKERITGVDFMEMLCKEVAASNAGTPEKPITVGFLGGGSKIAERTADCLVKKYPGLQVAFVGEEWPGEYNNYNGYKNYKSYIMDILFVAYGFPKQEEWMAKNLEIIPVKIAMAVGGSFDYISGNVPRAPLLIRSIGFEWLFRLVMQPWRIKRQLALLELIFLILKQKLTK